MFKQIDFLTERQAVEGELGLGARLLHGVAGRRVLAEGQDDNAPAVGQHRRAPTEQRVKIGSKSDFLPILRVHPDAGHPLVVHVAAQHLVILEVVQGEGH